MSLYRANFLVEAEPMSLGEYCLKAGWYLDGRNKDTPGYYLKYQPSGKTGWIEKELFEASYKKIEVLEE